VACSNKAFSPGARCSLAVRARFPYIRFYTSPQKAILRFQLKRHIVFRQPERPKKDWLDGSLSG